MNTSRVLTASYHLHRPTSKLGDEYDRIHAEARELVEAENMAATLHDDLTKHFVKIKATQRYLQEKALEYLQKLKPYSEKYQSYKLQLITRMIEVTSYMCVNDYESALEVAEHAIVFFENKPFEVKNAIVVFLHQKTVCCMQLKKFESGRESAMRSRSLVLEGTHNWYKDGLTFIQLCLHTQQYTEGWKVYVEMLGHTEYTNQSVMVKEEMSMIETYLQYLIYNENIKIEKNDRKFIKMFDYFGFMNTLPIFQKDKRGMNIPVLIAQILWILREKNYDFIKTRIEALDKYRTRHVSADEDTYRTNLFIKLVNQLEKGKYKRKRVEKRCFKTFEELRVAPIQVKNHAYATEILPYEDIWQLMMNSLS
jgi:tetratricopeptide (TPR) repeat protein